MPLNYRKNSITCTTDYYPDVSDLNGPGICQNNRININVCGNTKYIGLVASGHEQASDLSVTIQSQNLRLSKKSKIENKLYSWGYNLSGQLGQGNIIDSCIPKLVNSNCDFICVIPTHDYGVGFIGLTKNGKAFSWGFNCYGELGLNSPIGTCHLSPQPICCNYTYIDIISNNGVIIGLRDDNKAFSWGSAVLGRLGDGSTINKSQPVAVCCNYTYKKILNNFSNGFFGIKTDDTLVFWGYSSCGNSGDGALTSCRLQPVSVCCNYTYKKIIPYGERTFGIRTNDTLVSWGVNFAGQLGDGSTSCRLQPVLVCCNYTYKDIIVSGFSVWGIRTNDLAVSWGQNMCGQLGDGSISCRFQPVAVCCNYTYKCLYVTACGGSADTVFGLKTDNKLVSWGTGANAQLGNNTKTAHCLPQNVCGNYDYSKIFSFGTSVFGITNTGDIYSWGQGQLGTINSENLIPTKINIPFSINNMILNGNNKFVLTCNKKLYAWGDNSSGSLGNGNSISQLLPVQVCCNYSYDFIISTYVQTFGISCDWIGCNSP